MPKGDAREEEWTIAMHQAGHAVAAVVLRLGLRSVDLKQHRLDDGRILIGFTVIEELDASAIDGQGEEAAFPHLIQCFAGGFAESLIDGELRDSDRLQADVDEARRFAASAVCGISKTVNWRMEVTAKAQRQKKRKLELLERAAMAASSSLVKRHRSAITRVADMLRERTDLSAVEVAAVVRQYPPEAGTD